MPRQLLRHSCISWVALALTACSWSHVWGAETAFVLPKGVFRARLVSAQTSVVSEKFNSSGKTVPYSHSLNRSLTVSDFVNDQPELQRLVGVLNQLESGLGDQLLGVNLFGEFSTKLNSQILAFEYGWSNQLSLGLRIPVVTRSIEASFSAKGVNNANAISQWMSQNLSPQLAAGLSQVADVSLSSQYFTEKIFTEKGYDAPSSFSKTEVGDIEFGGKYQFYKSGPLALASQIGVRTPTGSTPSLTNIFDPGSGDGCWASGFSLFQEWTVSPYWKLAAFQESEFYFPDSRARAVPRDKSDGLPSLMPEDNQVEQVTRLKSPLFESEVSSTFMLAEKSIKFWGALQYARKGQDQYYGTGNGNYRLMEDGTNLEKTAAEIGLGYSAVPAYLKKTIAIPFEIEALYNQTLAGRNTPLVAYGRLDMIVYF